MLGKNLKNNYKKNNTNIWDFEIEKKFLWLFWYFYIYCFIMKNEIKISLYL